MHPLHKLSHMEQSTPYPYKKIDFKSANHMEFEVHQFLEEFAGAIRSGNLDRIISFYSSDIVAFACPAPLENRGIGHYRATWESSFVSNFSFPIECSFEKQKMMVSGELSVCHSLFELNAQTVKGEMAHHWLRSTIVVQRVNGEWKITHEHNSVPVDEDGKGMLDLGPDEALH